MNILHKRFGIGYLIVPLLVLNTVYSQPKTNRQILSEMLIEPVTQALDSISVKPNGVHLDLKSESELGKWLTSKLKERFLQRRLIVYDTLSSMTSQSLAIIIEKVNSQIRYRTADRNLFFRTSKYRRHVTVMLSFYIKNNGGSILYSRNTDYQYQDVIPSSAIQEVEDKFYPFTAGTKIESKIIKRLIEPVLITVTTAGVVYLFYTLRSGS